MIDVVESARRFAAVVRDLEEGARRSEAMLERLTRGATAFAELLAALDWPPAGHLPIQACDLMAEHFKRGELAANEIDTLLVEFYDAERLRGLLAAWLKHPWLAARAPILREAVECHVDRRYFAAVCTTIPQIEGVVSEVVVAKKFSPSNAAARLFPTSLLGRRAHDYFIAFFKRGFSPLPGAPVPSEARNAILHGRDTAFGTPTISLKTLLTFDAVVDATARVRGGSA